MKRSFRVHLAEMVTFEQNAMEEEVREQSVCLGRFSEGTAREKLEMSPHIARDEKPGGQTVGREQAV